ncbi:alpha/beta fold hydrolase [Tsuneonella sp. HG094]
MQTNCRAEVGVQQPFALVEVGGTTLAVARRGSGTPVICLHATGHGGRDYEPFANRVFGEGFEVIAVDWPGQGASPADASGVPASAQRYAYLLESLIPALKLDEPPIVIGNSIGGAAALELALRKPDAVRALVLCNPGGLAPLTCLARTGIAVMVALFIGGERGQTWFAPAFTAYYRMVLRTVPAEAQRRRIVAAGYETSTVMRQAWESFRDPAADLRARARALATPALFVWARHDRVVAWRWSRAAVTAIPRAQITPLEGGHTAFLESPDAFAAEFLRFARGLA